MKIICDTHIWYELGQKAPTDTFQKDNILIGTYNSIDELSRTFNLIKNSEYVRNAIKAIMRYSRFINYESPFIYLKRLDAPRFQFDIIKEYGNILKFTQEIANGNEINKGKIEGYKAYCQQRFDGLQEAANYFNEEASKIQPKITNKNKHRFEDSIPLNRNLISLFVAKMTNTDGLSENFNWSQIELFENVLKIFFNDMELGGVKLKPNDWFDLFLLIYVQPECKIWTKEKRWMRYIERADMKKYLFIS